MALVRLQRDGPVECKAMVFMWFYNVSAFPTHLTFQSMFFCLRSVRIVKLDNDSRDLSASTSFMFSQLKC